ncbi:hypothetical protein OXX80_014363, partial [Metschnikowia pulcherrima]
NTARRTARNTARGTARYTARWEQRRGGVQQASRVGRHIHNARLSRNRSVRVGGHKSGSVLSQSTARGTARNTARWEQRRGGVQQASRVGRHIHNTRLSRNRS